jgi:hypothetical protein
MADALLHTMRAHTLELIFERSVPRPERRAEIRHRIDLVCVLRRRYWRFSRARVIDLSADGMLVSFEQRLDDGASLEVSFKAAEPAIWFDARATVTRLVRGRRARDSGPALAMRFESLSAVAHLILRGHLRNLPRPPPLREPPAALVAKSEDYAGIVRDILEERPGPVGGLR